MIKKLNYINVLVWMVLIVCPFLLQEAEVITLSEWKISEDNGLISIVTGTFLHGSYSHMIGNLVGMLLGTSIVYSMYSKMYFPLIILGTIIPSSTMYFLGLDSVGISGLAFALIWFIIIRGLMSLDKVRFFSGVVVLLVFGQSLKTVFPQGEFSNIAWQAHLAGVLVSFSLALFSRIKR